MSPFSGTRRTSVVLTTTLGILAGLVVTSVAAVTTGGMPVVAAGTPVTDNFASGNYAGGAGWAAAWTETNDDAAAPIYTTGRVVVNANALRFTNIDTRTVQRTMNLSGFNEGAQLSFTVVSKAGDEALRVSMRTGNGASDFTQIAEMTTGAILSNTRYTFTLTAAMIRANGELRFSASDDVEWDADDIYQIDDIVIGNPVRNPNLSASCGVNLTVVLDESGSIDSAGATDEVEAAVDAFGDGLAGSGSTMRITEFSTNARDSELPTGQTSPQLVNNAYVVGPLNTYLTGPSPQPSDPKFFEPDNNAAAGQTFTNWEAGLFVAGTRPPSNYAIPPLVVFITDGDPNTIGTAGTSTDNNGGGNDNAAAAAVQEIETLKLAGAHVLAIGVGNASAPASFDRIKNLVEPVGPVTVWENVGTLDLATTDVIRVPTFAGLEAALQEVSTALCAQTLVVKKLDQAGAPLVRNFTTTVTGQAGAATSYQWLSPADATNPPPTSKIVATNGTTGEAEFKWTAGGRFATPTTWTSTASFTEPLPPGWTLPAAPLSPCTRTRPGVASLSVPLSASVSAGAVTTTRTATFTLGGGYVFAAGDTVRCTINNIAPGNIIVDKVATPVDSTAFPFDVSWLPGNPDFTLTSAGAPVDSGPLAPGTYTITEGSAGSWSLKSVTCNGQPQAVTNGSVSVTLAAGQTITCVFSNEKAGKIIINKASVGGVGTFGFTSAVAALTGNITTTVAGTAPSGNTLTADVAAGTYSVAESVPAGWDLTGSVCVESDTTGGASTVASIKVAAGETVTCTFTNTKKGQIIVKKTTVGGDNTFAFTSNVAGIAGNITTVGGVTPVGQERSALVVPGTAYAVAESTPPAGWTLTSATCSDGSPVTAINVSAGEVVTCTFANTRNSATLTLRKEWINGENTDTAALTINGINDDSDTATSNGTVGSQISAQQSTTTILAGETVNLSEVLGATNKAAYDTTLSCGGVDVPLTALAGTYTVPAVPVNVTCTFKNVAKRGTIIIVKSAVGGDDTFNFTGSWLNPTSFNITTVGGTANKTYTNVLAGSYTVNETSPAPAWDLTTLVCSDSVPGGTASSPATPTLDAVGSIKLDAGETVTCTYTNTKRGSITIVKDVTNTPNGFDPKAFDFGGTLGTFTLKDDGIAPADNSISFGNLVPGNFSVTETNANTGGFGLTGVNCGSATVGTPPTNGVLVALQAGQNVTCTFTNQAQGALTINKTAKAGQPVVVDSNTFTVAYDVVVNNTGPGQTTYTLTDTPNFGAGTTITNIAVGGAAVINPYTSGANIVTGKAINGGASDTYTVTVTFDVAADMVASERLCGTTPTPGQATYNLARITFPGNANGITDDDCVNIPDPTLNIAKTKLAGQPVVVDANTFTVAYDVTVTNPGAGQTTYTLTDTPNFGAGTTITNIAISNGATINPYTSGANIVTGKTINAGVTDTYRVTVTFDVAADMTSAERLCGTTPTPGQGTYNSATITFPGGPKSANDCANIPDPTLNIAKTKLAGQPVVVDANTFTVAYDVTVTNPGAGQTTYTLTDTPNFGAGTTITNIAISNGATINPYTSGANIVTGKTINAGVTDTYRVTVTFDVAADMTSAERLCGTTPTPGQGTYNSATITFPGGPKSANDCANIPDPTLNIAKTKLAGQPVVVDANTFTVAYDVTVTNPGAGQTTYTLTDTPNFGAGTTITNIAISNGATINPYTSGANIVTGKTINAGVTDTYRVTVTFDVAADMTSAERLCGTTPTPGQGTYNSATITFPGGPKSANDCANIPDPNISVLKQVVAAPAQPVQVGSGFQYTVDYTVTVTNTGTGLGSYTLSDAPAFGFGTSLDAIALIAPVPAGANGSFGLGDLNIVTAPKAIAGGASDVFTVRATFTVAGSTTSTARDCALDTGENGTGTRNSATVTPTPGTASTSTACAVIPDPNITVTKDVATGPTYDAVTDSYTMTYDVNVTNNGAGPGTFTLTDTPTFGGGTTITTVGATSTDFTVNPAFAAPGGTIVTNEPIAAGATKSATVTVVFTVDGSSSSTDRDCILDEGENGTGTLNNATVDPNIGPDDTDSDCEEIPNPGISVLKQVVAAPSQPVQVGSGFQYTVDYTITVTNTGGAAGTYTLTDTPAFGTGATIDSIALIAPIPAGSNPGFGLGDLSIVTAAKSIGVGVSHVYTVRATFTVVGSMTAAERECGDPETSGNGTFNTATVNPSIGPDTSSSDCADIPDPDITVTKDVATGPTYDAVTDSYTMTYDVNVTNNGAGPGTFTLTDTPTFGGGTTITTVGATSTDFTVNPAFAAPGGTIVTNEPIAAGATKSATVTVVFTVDGSSSSTDRDCILDEGENGTGTLNNATVDPNIGPDDTDSDCEEIPNPKIAVSKTVTTDPAPTAPGSSTWTIGYTIEITNDGNGPGTYDLTDVPGFASGLTITDHQATSTDITINGDFNTNLASSSIATDAEIASGATQQVEVVVTFTFPADLDSEDRECGEVPATGEATFNQATVTPNIGDPDTGEDCGSLPDPEIDIEKTVTSGPTNNGDGTFSVGYTITVTNDGTGPGEYDLSDAPAFSPGLTIESLTVANDVPGTIVTNPSFGVNDEEIVTGQEIAEGDVHTYLVDAVIMTDFDGEDNYEPCSSKTGEEGEGLFNRATITVDGEPTDAEVCEDLPGDLQIFKSDGGAIALVGGAPFTYTLTISNVGGIGTGSPVTVTDVLPPQFEWVSFPEGPALPACVQGTDPSQNTLTCEIDSTLVDLGGESTTLELTAQAKAGTEPSEEGYENLSYVDSPDDPAPDEPECPSEEVEEEFDIDSQVDRIVSQLVQALGANPDNNVSCDSTPVVDSSITVTKEDSLADSDLVLNGQTFSYNLTVKNNGPEPVDTVKLTDDLPNAALTLVSVTAGAGWTCNAVDPIACSLAGVLAPGATSTIVKVTVKVKADFVGDSITNTAKGSAIVRNPNDPTDNKTVKDEDPEVTGLERSLDVTGFTSVCIAEAPYISYDINTLGFVMNPFEATLTIQDLDGNPVDYNGDGTVDDDDKIVVDSATGKILYPGAELDDEGNVVDWPGWKFEDGLWVVDESDDYLRDGLKIQVEVNPTATATVTYPPASSKCANPKQVSADLKIVKIASDTTPTPGDSFDWTLTVSNLGPDTATNVVVKDTVPSTLTVTGVASDAFSCSAVGNAVTCKTPSFAKGAVGVVTIRVDVPDNAAPGSIRNVSTVSAVTPDPNLSNNTDDATVTIQAIVLPPPPPPPPPDNPLPATGGDVGDLLRLAAITMAAGFVLYMIQRRRVSPPS